MRKIIIMLCINDAFKSIITVTIEKWHLCEIVISFNIGVVIFRSVFCVPTDNKYSYL